jgi:hypothetical protein
MRSISLELKYVFLSFAQELFKANPKYTWTYDPRTTKVVIADKYSADRGTVAKRPSIIVSREAFRWSGSFRQDGIGPQKPQAQQVQQQNPNNLIGSTFTDLLQAAVTFQVIAQRPAEADELANQLFLALTAYRAALKQKGIHQITSLSLSEERVLDSGAEIKLTGVTITLSFVSQISVQQSDNHYNSKIFVDGSRWYEGIDYKILPGGSQIQFARPIPDGITPVITYIDAITLDEVSEKHLLLLAPGSILYVVPENGTIYSYYTIFQQYDLESTLI